MSHTPRLHRLLGADGKCLNVAVDHGFFNEWDFLQGIEDMSQVVATLAPARPDAIQLTVGMARHLQLVRGGHKPALVLRTDVANVYGRELPAVLFSQMIENAVEQAIRWDAACVVVNLFRLPHQPDVHHQCVRNICRLKPLCERYGMPLMVEPLVMQPNSKGGGYMVDGDLRKIVPLVRQATELGADIIKADPCDHLDEYHQVVRAAAGCPVLPRGGGKVSDDELLTRTRKLMDQGASGVVYGRNIIQHQTPVNMVRALMAIIHEGCSTEQAKSYLS